MFEDCWDSVVLENKFSRHKSQLTRQFSANNIAIFSEVFLAKPRVFVAFPETRVIPTFHLAHVHSPFSISFLVLWERMKRKSRSLQIATPWCRTMIRHLHFNCIESTYNSLIPLNLTENFVKTHAFDTLPPFNYTPDDVTA